MLFVISFAVLSILLLRIRLEVVWLGVGVVVDELEVEEFVFVLLAWYELVVKFEPASILDGDEDEEEFIDDGPFEIELGGVLFEDNAAAAAKMAADAELGWRWCVDDVVCIWCECDCCWIWWCKGGGWWAIWCVIWWNAGGGGAVTSDALAPGNKLAAVIAVTFAWLVVLLVDDDALLVAAFAILFRELGTPFEVDNAKNWSAAAVLRPYILSDW